MWIQFVPAQEKSFGILLVKNHDSTLPFTLFIPECKVTLKPMTFTFCWPNTPVVSSHIFVTFSIILSIYPQPVVHWQWWLMPQQMCWHDGCSYAAETMRVGSDCLHRLHENPAGFQHTSSTRRDEQARYKVQNTEAKVYNSSKRSWAGTLPCFSTSFKGSTPGERMKNMGVAGPDSSKETAKSRDLPITYLLPSFSSTKSLRGEYDSVLCNTFYYLWLTSWKTWRVGFFCSTLRRKNINSSHDSLQPQSFSHIVVCSLFFDPNL